MKDQHRCGTDGKVGRRGNGVISRLMLEIVQKSKYARCSPTYPCNKRRIFLKGRGWEKKNNETPIETGLVWVAYPMK